MDEDIPGGSLAGVLERLAPVGGGRALVVEAGQVVGVTASDITRVIDVRGLALPAIGR